MIKVVQFGEGNFLRTFVDLYFDTLNKEGGEYKTTEAEIVKIRYYERELILNTGEVIAIDKIAAIEGDVFDKLEFQKEEAAQGCAYEEDYNEF